jgi:hypothetical protein
MKEFLKTDLGLSREELEEFEAKRKLKNSRRGRATHGAVKKGDDQRAYEAKALAIQKFYCNICNSAFGTGAFSPCIDPKYFFLAWHFVTSMADTLGLVSIGILVDTTLHA